MKRYSKRVIEEACWLLSAWASNRDDIDPANEPAVGCAESLCGHNSETHKLALDAYWHALDTTRLRGPEQDAEAEALLRCGWRPS